MQASRAIFFFLTCLMLAPHSADTVPTRHNLREPTQHRHDVRQADTVQCRQHGLCHVGDMAPTCWHVCRFKGKKSPTRCRHFQQSLCLPLKPTPMWRMLCRCQHQICPAGRTVPIVLSSLRRRRTLSSSRRALMVIEIVINKFVSSFNDADPSHIVLVDCCMLYYWECGPIMAV